MRSIAAEDVLIVIGMLLIGVGLWFVSVPAMLVVEGAILLLLGLFAAMRSR